MLYRNCIVWSLYNLFSALGVGLFIGREGQLFADSGEYIPDKVYISMVIGGGSYLIAFLVFNWFKIFKFPNWFTIAVSGSIICSLSIHVIKFLIVNWSWKEQFDPSSTAAERILERFPSFFVMGVVYSIFAVVIIGAPHIIFYLSKRYKAMSRLQ